MQLCLRTGRMAWSKTDEIAKLYHQIAKEVIQK